MLAYFGSAKIINQMDKTTFSFIKLTIPSVFSFVLAGLYCFVDAFFVGNSVGDTGIAAINISYSILSLMQACACGIGIGASVKYTVCKTIGKIDEAKSFIICGFFLMFAAGIIIAFPLIAFPKSILLLLGASTSIAEIGIPYIRIFAYGSLFQIVGTGLIPITRNCGGSVRAMTSMIAGLAVNIFLDWLFVWIFGWGLTGAAFASVAAQCIALLLCADFVIRNKIPGKSKLYRNFGKTASKIIGIGLSPFGLELIPNVSIIILNRYTRQYGGDRGLASYGIVAYIVFIALLIVQGINDGAQPLVSTFYASSDMDNLRKVRKLSMTCSISVSIACAILCSVFGYQIGRFMGSSEEASQLVKRGMVIFMAGLPFSAVSRTIASCLYAAEENKKSYFISFSEPLFIGLFILFLPLLLGLDGVWISNSSGQAALMIISLLLFLVPDGTFTKHSGKHLSAL